MYCKAKVHYGKRMVAAHARKEQVEISGEKKSSMQKGDGGQVYMHTNLH